MAVATRRRPVRSSNAPRSSPCAGVLRELRKAGITAPALASLLGVDQRSVDRWTQGRSLGRLEGYERLVALRELVDLARRVHGPRALDWFSTPNRQLGNLRPLTALQDPNGIALLRSMLENALMGGVA